MSLTKDLKHNEPNKARRHKFEKPLINKICCVCKQQKDIINFHASGKYVNGIKRYTSYCKQCRSVIDKESKNKRIKNKLCLSCNKPVQGPNRTCQRCIKNITNNRINLKKKMYRIFRW